MIKKKTPALKDGPAKKKISKAQKASPAAKKPPLKKKKTPEKKSAMKEEEKVAATAVVADEETLIMRMGVAAKAKILSVDDEEVIRSLISKILTKAGYEVELAESGEDALKVMKKQSFDLAIIDLKMPGMGGMGFLGEMKKLYPETEAIILTGFGEIETAVEALKIGAFNFLPKPFKKEVFLSIIANALDRRMLRKEVEETKTAMDDIKSKASRDIGELKGQLQAVEEAKKELGEHFNAIKQSLIDGTGEDGKMEKKVFTLEKVATQIKAMEQKLVANEKASEDAFANIGDLEADLGSEVSGQVERGVDIEDAKTGLENLKKKVKKESAPEKEASEGEISLSDIHQALADFKTEIESD